ncbi:unnamed protein product, partial [marine sediment metagenome]
MNKARRALSKKDYDRAEAMAQLTLGYWANTKSTTALQGVLDDVRTARATEKREVAAKVTGISKVRESRLGRTADIAEGKWKKAQTAYDKAGDALAEFMKKKSGAIEKNVNYGEKGAKKGEFYKPLWVEKVKKGKAGEYTSEGKAEQQRRQAAWDAADEALGKARKEWDAAEENVLTEAGERFGGEPAGAARANSGL